MLQRKPRHSGLSAQDSEQVSPIVHDVLRSPGQPLEPATRAAMEPHFVGDFGRVQARGAQPASEALIIGPSRDPLELEAESQANRVDQTMAGAIPGRSRYDFSQVRVHHDAKAAESARAVDARAYTVGRDIVFAAGQYAPHNAAGRRLLAHELTHVVQQSVGGSATIAQRQGAGNQNQAPVVVAPVAPNKTQQKMIDDARRAAAIRTQVAMFRASGIEGAMWDHEARRLAQIKFDWPNPNMEQISGILGNMGAGLVTVDVKVAGAGDAECGSRSGYVRGHRPPIVLCPAFFTDPSGNEGRIRTMVHEMAHVVGVGDASVGEQYFPVFDCDSPGAFESADSWSNYVHCLSGQTPDKPVTITGTPRGGGGRQTTPTPGGRQ